MRPITDIFELNKRTISFEIFPPKTDQGMASLDEAIAGLAELAPDFVSVTYGAGGSSRDMTLEIVQMVQEKYDIPAMHHFTCVLHSRTEIQGILDRLQALNIRNILALRGDPPKENPDWKPGSENFKYSSDLVKFIREHYGDFFSIGVAGFPQGHPMAPDLAFDAKILKTKIDVGGDFVVTQLFFDNREYFDYVKRLRGAGVSARVIPGVLPITNYEGVIKFCKGCGASVPQKVHDLFGPIAGDKEKTLEAGIRFAVEQCLDLLAEGAPGIHFYTLNRVEPVRTILNTIREKVWKIKPF